MRPLGLLRSLVSLALCTATWAMDPTDTIMDADSAAVGYLPNHNMDPATIEGGAFGQIWSFTTPKNPLNQIEQFYSKLLVYTPKATGKQTVIAFSEQNRIYVLDAVNGTLYNSRDLSEQDPAEAPFMVSDLGNCNDISGTIGITGTPIIDPNTETIYFWAKGYRDATTKGWKNGAYRFHAIDAWTLQERPGFPTNIEGKYADNDKTRYFTGGGVLQRTSLNLINGVVYAGFGGHCDLFNYTGWVVGMRASSGEFVTAYAAAGGDRAPKQDGTWEGGGGGCGIWQSGAILASDNPSRLFFATGNGYGVMANQQLAASGRIHLDTLSEAIVNMAIDPATGKVTQQDYFEPYTYQAIDSADRDLGGGGVSILPFGGGGVKQLAVTAGKNGQAYICNADNLGGYKMGAGGGDAIIQTITPPQGTAMFGNVGAYPLEGGYMYITPVGAPTYAYALGYDSSGKPAFSVAGSTPDKSAGRVGTGSATITTLNGQPGTGILWMSDPDNGIRAYHAVPRNGQLVKIPLPATPVLSKFQRPVFGDGRYYTSTYTGQILAFGSPVKLPFDCGGPFNFGEVPIGTSKTINVTCTAKINVNQITNITTGNPLYKVSLADLPKTGVTAGKSFTFPIKFDLGGYTLDSGSTSSPTMQPGVQSGSVTLNTVNAVTGYSTAQPLSVTGNTVTDGPFAAINPNAVDFQPLVIGSASAEGGSQNTVVIQNLGKGPMKILGYAFTTDGPNSATAKFTNVTIDGTHSKLDADGYFTAEDLPELGSTVAAGSSVIIHMTFLAPKLGSFSTTFTVFTDGGMAYSVLTGSANSQPIALLEHSTSEGGWVTIPFCNDPTQTCTFNIDMGTSPGLTTTEVTIRFTNKGGSDLMIDKSKPPMGSVLGAQNPSSDLFEGMVIKPGKSESATIFFTPGAAPLNADPIVYSGAWTLNVNDLAFGVHVVNFIGTLRATKVGPTLPDGSARFKYLGCYKDSNANRLETTQAQFPADNDNGKCQQYAITNKAAFAGTQYTYECWVGRSIPPASLKVDDYLCNTYVCPGDKSQFCGGVGSYMMMWYDTTGYFPENGTLAPAFRPPANKAVVGNWEYAGCRTDNSASPATRALNDRIVGQSSTNTVESCAAACAGFSFFGVEWGVECYCGNKLNTGSTVADEKTCNYVCGGDPTELCGGSGRISVYKQKGTVIGNPSSGVSSSSATASGTASATASASSTSSSAVASGTPGNPQSVGQYGFLGCYSDAVASRSLQGKNTQSNVMNLNDCATYCAGYKYFGTEYSAECFCGNDLLNGAALVTDGRCNMLCNGNQQQICGGSNGLSMYQLNPNGTSSSVTASGSATQSATASGTASGTASSTASGPASGSNTASATTTSSAAPTTPTVTVKCPDNNNGTYLSLNGKTFLLECFTDHEAGDLALAFVDSYALCAEKCSTTDLCVAFSYVPGGSGIQAPCYMKKSVGRGYNNQVVWGAQIIAVASSSTTTSAAAAPTSAAGATGSTAGANPSGSVVTGSTAAGSTAAGSTAAGSTAAGSTAASATGSAATSATSAAASGTAAASTVASGSGSGAASGAASTAASTAASGTASASVAPSDSVAPSVSIAPTGSVAPSASVAPTNSASVAPGSNTSVAPTNSASVAPTNSASIAPTNSASVAPTNSASIAPTNSASVAPTNSASIAPTNSASVAPTNSASVAPTNSASIAPTASVAPSVAPGSSSSTTAPAVVSTTTTAPAVSSAPPAVVSTTITAPAVTSAPPVAGTTTTAAAAVTTTAPAPATTTTAAATTSTTNTVPASPTIPTVVNWDYQGCASDNNTAVPTARALNGTYLYDTAGMTIQKCLDFCAQQNYPLAGLEFQSQCYCGLEFKPGYGLGQTGCNLTCIGDPSTRCGGRARLDVFRQTNYVTPRLVNPSVVNGTLANPQGCFVDNSTARILKAHTYTNGTSMTVEMCHERCQTRGYSLFGVEFGKECYCGNALADTAKAAPELYECKRSFCAGDKTEFCGAGSRLLLYSIQPAETTLPTRRSTGRRGEGMVKVKLPKLRKDEESEYELSWDGEGGVGQVKRSGSGWKRAERRWGRGPGR